MRNTKIVILLAVLVAALVGGLYALNSVLFEGPGSVEDSEDIYVRRDRVPEFGKFTLDPDAEPPPVDRPRGNPVLFSPGVRPPRPGPDEIVELNRVQGLLDIALGDDQAAAQKAWTELGDLIRMGVLNDPVGVAGALVVAMETGGNAAIWAAKILPWISDETAREKMSRDLVDLAIRSQDVQVLKAAFRAIGDVGEESAVADLGRLSRSLSDHNAVCAAIHAIGQIGSEESTQVLTALLLDRIGTEVAPAIVKEMGAVKTPEMVAALLPLTETGRSVEVRLAAIDALGLTGRPEGVAVLEEIIDGDDGRMVKTVAFAALGRIGTPESLETLIRTFRAGGDLAQSAGLAVGNSSNPEGVKTILGAIDSIEDDRVKVRLVEALGNSKSHESYEKLREMVSSAEENPAVRGRAAVSLARLGDAKAVTPITDLLAGASSGDSNMVIHLTDALKRLAQYPEARKELIEKSLPVLEQLTDGPARGHVYYYALSARQTLEACRQR